MLRRSERLLHLSQVYAIVGTGGHLWERATGPMRVIDARVTQLNPSFLRRLGRRVSNPVLPIATSTLG